MREVYLLTKLNGADRWTFAQEADIINSLQITYSNVAGMRIDVLSRDLYVVKYTREDVVNTDVFTVQRVPLLEVAAHL